MSDPYPSVVGALPSDPYEGRGHDEHIAAAAQAIAQQSTASFTLGDQTFELRDSLDVRVLIALQRGDFARALEMALVDGPAGVDRVMSVDEPLSPERLKEILTLWAKRTQGADLGESSALPR